MKIIWISYVLFIGALQEGESAFLRCYNGSLDSYLVTDITEPVLLSPPSCLDLNIPTVFYTFGYQGKVDGPATTSVLNAYLQKQKRNVVLVDWQQEAKTSALGIPLTYALYAVPNAKKVGMQLGDAIVRLMREGLKLTDVHLMGHSLGAHLMGHAGRHVRSLGYTVARITGLDPARALYEGTLTLQKGLDRTCARFVDIFHTSPGGYGSNVAKGTVDFWPNYSGSPTVQPGCPVGTFESFSKEDLCSHDRSWQYYVESISRPTAFAATLAADYDAWLAKKTAKNVTYLGDLVNTRTSGNYFLTTNPSSPFGRSDEGLLPDANQSRRRRNTGLPRWLKFFR